MNILLCLWMVWLVAVAISIVCCKYHNVFLVSLEIIEVDEKC